MVPTAEFVNRRLIGQNCSTSLILPGAHAVGWGRTSWLGGAEPSPKAVDGWCSVHLLLSSFLIPIPQSTSLGKWTQTLKLATTSTDIKDNRHTFPVGTYPGPFSKNDSSSVAQVWGGAATETANRVMPIPCHPTTLADLLRFLNFNFFFHSVYVCKCAGAHIHVHVYMCVHMAREQPQVSFFRSHLPWSSLVWVDGLAGQWNPKGIGLFLLSSAGIARIHHPPWLFFLHHSCITGDFSVPPGPQPFLNNHSEI